MIRFLVVFLTLGISFPGCKTGPEVIEPAPAVVGGVAVCVFGPGGSAPVNTDLCGASTTIDSGIPGYQCVRCDGYYGCIDWQYRVYCVDGPTCGHDRRCGRASIPKPNTTTRP